MARNEEHKHDGRECSSEALQASAPMFPNGLLGQVIFTPSHGKHQLRQRQLGILENMGSTDARIEDRSGQGSGHRLACIAR
jgi:hypothetical protein